MSGESDKSNNSWDLGTAFCVGTEFEPVAEIYANAWPRIARAINWAAKYRIGVLVDLHGESPKTKLTQARPAAKMVFPIPAYRMDSKAYSTTLPT